MEIGEQGQGNVDEAAQPQQPIMDPAQFPLISGPLQTNHMTGNSSSLLVGGLVPSFPFPITPSQLPQQHIHHQQLPQSDQQLHFFWTSQLQEIRANTDFKNHNLPLARIKKIMKADEDVKMIAAETPVLFSRACEMFILELTHRSWGQTEHSKRRTLQRSDIASAIAKNQVFDFLVDIVPVEETKEAGVPTMPVGEGLNDSISYFYDPSKFGSLMMDMRNPEVDCQGLTYTHQHQD
ncbi:Nuclear transcription factor Y subunit C-2 [Apostasia shenzhenica]|uniref:Nuclear transcription factor Y subunit C-2 n=1 Tax=Apostasia shenzhenica TaxID=1088818 RepID=A0A2H9ZQS6_9ASPA|nr:Nuclear transcription factor Y subunit C-2 [Apostasia shenzhenica]